MEKINNEYEKPQIKINRKEFFKKLELSFTNPDFFEQASKDFFKRIKGESFPSDGKTLIKVVGLNKTFPTATEQMNILFDDVNLSIKRGDVISLIGANGTGKTTMLDIIVGYQRPTKGKIEYDLKYNLSPTEKFGISYQRNTLLPSLSVWDYMEFVHKLYKSSTTMNDLVIFVYAFGIEKFCRMKVNKLSGGQQQRLNAMLSLFHNPEILLLDELCNNLDLNIKKQIISFIKEYIRLKNITAIIISHDVYEISHMSNRVVVIKDHKIFFDDTVKNILKGEKTLDTIVAESI